MRLNHKQEKEYCLWDALQRFMFIIRFVETGQVVQVFEWGQANKETDE